MIDDTLMDAKTIQELVDGSGLSVKLQDDETLIETRAPRQNPSQSSLGRYKITGHLGEGGMGEVLQVRDEDVGREMAAKVIRGQVDRKLLTKFIQEAQVTGQLEHPNIVPMHELGMTPAGQIYFTMKRVEGQTLAELLEQENEAEGQVLSSGDSGRRIAGDLASHRRKSLMKYIDILLKVCDAMAFAHSRGVIHRDLKPANIMVGRFGEVQVMDWGLSKVVGQPDPLAEGCTLDLGGGRIAELAEQDEPLRTLDGAVLGTPAYMSPEQARGDIDQLDQRTDVYALGAILFQILTLEPPYRSRKVWNVVRKVIAGELVPPSELAPQRDVPWEIEAVVLRAMAGQPEKRYETVQALSADLEAWIAGRTLGAAQYSPLSLLKNWVGRNRALCLGAAAVLIATLGIVGWMRWQRYRQVQSHLARATEAAGEGKYEQAIREFGQLLAIVPDHRPARAAMVQVYLSAVDKQLAEQPGAEALAARWKARDKALKAGLAERPEEPEAQQRREASLNAYLAGVATLSQARARFPDSQALRKRRIEAGRALGWIALIGRDYSLARQAFRQLEQAGLEPKLAEALADRVRQDRSRRLGLWKVRVNSILADFRQGLSREGRDTRAGNYEDHRIEVAGYNHPEIAELLGRELQRFTELRSAHKGPGKLVWLPPQRQLVTFLCQALGRLPQRESVAALGAWMRVVTDQPLAAEAGIALCNTRRPEAHDMLTAAMRRLGENSSAWDQINPFFARVPDPLNERQLRTVEDYNNRGLFRKAKGNFAGAIRDFSLAIKVDPKHPAPYNNRGLAYHDQGKLEAAIQDYTRATEVDPQYAGAYHNRAIALEDKQDHDGAMADYTRAIQLNPKSTASYNNRGVLRQMQGDLAGALEDFERAVKLAPGRSDGYTNRANARKAQGDLKGALADCSKAIKLNPRSAAAYCSRANIRKASGDLDGAITDYSTAIKIAPRSSAPYTNRANARSEKGNLAGAINDYSMSLKIDPQDASTYSSRGLAYKAKGELKAAIRDFDKAIEINPRQANAYYRRGRARERQGDLDSAIDDYTSAIRIDPRYSRAYYDRGFARQASKDLAGAIEDFSATIKLDPKDAFAYSARGDARRAQGKLDSAIEDYTAAIERHPKNAAAHYGRGVARRRQRKLDSAIEDFRLAIKFFPKYARAYYYLGLLRKEKGDLTGAINDFTSAIKLDPRFASAYTGRGNARRAKGDRHGAIADFTKAIEFNPRSATAHYNRGIQRKAARNLDGAIEDFNRAIKLSPRLAAAYVARANAYLLKRKLDKSRADYARALEIDPRYWRAWVGRGILEILHGKKAAGRASLQRALKIAPARYKPSVIKIIDKYRKR